MIIANKFVAKPQTLSIIVSTLSIAISRHAISILYESILFSRLHKSNGKNKK